MKTLIFLGLSIFSMITPCTVNAQNAQHLWWAAEADGKVIERMTFLYGEIEVLRSGPTIYYCGVNWQPGNPAGGYCGIQDHQNRHRCVIFSVWDTSPKLHPRVVQVDKRTIHNRFGGEGEGSHTHINYRWKQRGVFKFVVTKCPDISGKSTLTTFYFYDRRRRKWILEATISSPTDNEDSVRYFGGAMNSFLENWSGKRANIPKLCLYRLWAGTTPDNLKFLRKSTGDGHWGILNGSYYLAEGKGAVLDAFIAKRSKSVDNVIRAGKGAQIPLIPDRTLPPAIVKSLKALPRPDDV